MTLTVTSAVPGPGLSPEPVHSLLGEPGDTLVIDGAGMAGLPRIGTIIAVPHQDGTPPFLVHWTAGDYESRIRSRVPARSPRRWPCAVRR